MKKLNHVLLLLGVFGSFISCNDNDQIGEEYIKASAVKIISSDLSFSANENKGEVSFEAPASVSASVNTTWATAIVNGNTVQINVTRNPKLEGRSALLTIKCGNDSTNVPIHQKGMIFKYGGDNTFTYNDEARSLTLPVANEGSNLSIKTPEWASATINDEAMTIHLSQNNSGHIRSGYIYYQAGPYVDSLYIKQGERTDIVNKNFFFAGYDLTKLTSATQSYNELLTGFNATIMEEEGNLFLFFPDNDWSLPLIFDEENLTLDVCSGQYMGTYYNKYFIFSSIIDSNWYNTFTDAGYNVFFSYPGSPYFRMTASLDYNKKYGITIAYFENKAGNDRLLQSIFGDPTVTYEADVIAFTAYKTSTVNASGYTSDLILFAYPYLQEYLTSSSSKPVLKLSDEHSKLNHLIQKMKR